MAEDDSVAIPVYETQTGMAVSGYKAGKDEYKKQVSRPDYLLLEGDFQPLPRDWIDYSIYLDVPDEVRMANRMRRDLKEGREASLESIKESFMMRQPQFEKYTLPNKKEADLVLNVRSRATQDGNNVTFEYSF